MATAATPGIEQILKKNQTLPVYFLFGDDAYQTEKNLELLEEYYEKQISKDFDWRVFHAKNDFDEVWSEVTSFPFSSEKKFVVLREAEKRDAKDFDILMKYIKAPVPTTVLVVSYDGKLDAKHKKFATQLTNSGFTFESKSLRNDNLEEWITRYAGEKGKVITRDGAQLMIEQSGDDRSILEMQLNKILLYVGDSQEKITREVILSQNVKTKTYELYEIDNALKNRNKSEAFKIIFSMLDYGEYPLPLIGYLNSLFFKVGRIADLSNRNFSPKDIAKMVDTFEWKLDIFRSLARVYPPEKRKKIAEALLAADVSCKTSQFDPKLIMTNLLTEILQ